MNDTYLLCLVKSIDWDLKDQDPLDFPEAEFCTLMDRQREAVSSFRVLMLELSNGTKEEALAFWADHIGPRYPFPKFLFKPERT